MLLCINMINCSIAERTTHNYLTIQHYNGIHKHQIVWSSILQLECSSGNVTNHGKCAEFIHESAVEFLEKHIYTYLARFRNDLRFSVLK